MAHVHTLGEVAPKAMPILHLGVTSAFVQDNTDLVQIREGLLLVKKKLINVIQALHDFAWNTKICQRLDLHIFKLAQLTTVGKRATLCYNRFYWILKNWNSESIIFALEE